MRLEATKMSGRSYAVRPEGCLGTCGYLNGRSWQVVYVTAASPEQAISRARKMHWWLREMSEA